MGCWDTQGPGGCNHTSPPHPLLLPALSCQFPPCPVGAGALSSASPGESMWLSMAPQIYSTVLQLCLRPDFFQGLLHRVPGPSYRLVFSPLPLLERIRLCHSPLSLLHMGAPEGCGEGAGMLALGGRTFRGCHSLSQTVLLVTNGDPLLFCFSYSLPDVAHSRCTKLQGYWMR